MRNTIVLLHGWKVPGDRYKKLTEILEKKDYRVLVPDMPGFNGIPLTKEIMTLDDYVTHLKELLKKESVERSVFVGHSFGGRVAAKFAYRYPSFVDKLILSGAPLINKKSLKKIFAHAAAVTGKKTVSFLPSEAQDVLRKLLYRSLGEWDYYKAGDLQKTFVSIINENLSPILPQINVPTLLIWGEKDTFVPVSVGREIVSKIPGAIIAVLPHESHKVPYENPEKFAQNVLSFILP